MAGCVVTPLTESGQALVNFNQNFTCLTVSSRTGYTLYTLDAVDVLHKFYTHSLKEIFIVERLFETSLILIVARNPRTLKVFHVNRQVDICNYSYPDTILSIKLNRDRAIVCLENKICIHNIADMKVIYTVVDMPNNPNGLCALSPSMEQPYLAYPISSTTGQLQIFNVVTFCGKLMIPAHEGVLTGMAFNQSGTEIATVSERGTLIRVFSISNGDKLFEMRRSFTRCPTVSSISFSVCNKFLIVASDTETVHIFQMNRVPAENKSAEKTDDWMGKYFKYLGNTVTNYLPSPVVDVFTQTRPYATVTLPKSGMRRTCALITVQNQLRILIASEDGFLYVYSMPAEAGGECKFIKKHDLLHDDYYCSDARDQISLSSSSTSTAINYSTASADQASKKHIEKSSPSTDNESGIAANLDQAPSSSSSTRTQSATDKGSGAVANLYQAPSSSNTTSTEKIYTEQLPRSTVKYSGAVAKLYHASSSSNPATTAINYSTASADQATKKVNEKSSPSTDNDSGIAANLDQASSSSNPTTTTIYYSTSSAKQISKKETENSSPSIGKDSGAATKAP